MGNLITGLNKRGKKKEEEEEAAPNEASGRDNGPLMETQLSPDNALGAGTHSTLPYSSSRSAEILVHGPVWAQPIHYGPRELQDSPSLHTRQSTHRVPRRRNPGEERKEDGGLCSLEHTPFYSICEGERDSCLQRNPTPHWKGERQLQ